MTRSRLWLVVLVLAALAGGLAGLTSATAPVGHAAGMTMSSNRLSTFRPSGLPPTCSTPSQTLTAANDTWVNENAPTQANGAATTLTVTSRTSRNTRTLVRFTLPTTPTGCTLTAATLRLYNATPSATTRTIQAFRAGATWTDTVTWSTQPAVAGTAVTATSPAVAAWMQWSVLTHVQTMYSGTNTGFILRDAAESGATGGGLTQVFQSTEATSKPELVLTWS